MLSIGYTRYVYILRNKPSRKHIDDVNNNERYKCRYLNLKFIYCFKYI